MRIKLRNYSVKNSKGRRLNFPSRAGEIWGGGIMAVILFVVIDP
jgi:hypothetical protein